jgi:preprotein translocase subunit YajC
VRQAHTGSECKKWLASLTLLFRPACVGWPATNERDRKVVARDAAKTYPRSMMMKRTIFALVTMLVVFVAVFAVLVLRPVPKVKAHRGCSTAVLNGNYVLTASGFVGTTAPFNPLSVVGTVEFDGRGGVSYMLLSKKAGVTSYQNDGSGTYSVDSSCKASVLTGALDGVGEYLIFNGPLFKSALLPAKISALIVSSGDDVTGTAVIEEEAKGED